MRSPEPRRVARRPGKNKVDASRVDECISLKKTGVSTRRSANSDQRPPRVRRTRGNETFSRPKRVKRIECSAFLAFTVSGPLDERALNVWQRREGNHVPSCLRRTPFETSVQIAYRYARVFCFFVFQIIANGGPPPR